MVILDIQRDSGDDSPDDAHLRHVAAAALHAAGADGEEQEISLRIVDHEEMRELNGRYRKRAYATNVLSFPAQLPEDVALPLLGDIVICAPVVRAEAEEQGKAWAAHWDHMLAHGVLHLLGYDHEEESDALQMETIERRAMAALGWPDPYAVPVEAEAAQGAQT